jgi:hypothetical protein
MLAISDVVGVKVIFTWVRVIAVTNLSLTAHATYSVLLVVLRWLRWAVSAWPVLGGNGTEYTSTCAFERNATVLQLEDSLAVTGTLPVGTEESLVGGRCSEEKCGGLSFQS